MYEVKGTKTHLTYGCKIYNGYGIYKNVDVYAPKLRPARFFGLIPSKIVYKHVFTWECKSVTYKVDLTPRLIIEMTHNAVAAYEEHLITWENDAKLLKKVNHD